MDHDQQLELLSAYHDGELDDEDRAIVEKLLNEDKDAAFESTQLLNMKKFIQRWDGVPGSGRVRQAILDQVGASRPESPASGLVSFLLGVFAALLVLAGAAFLFHFFGGFTWVEQKLYGVPKTPPVATAPKAPPVQAASIPAPRTPVPARPVPVQPPQPPQPVRMPASRGPQAAQPIVPKGTAWVGINKFNGGVSVRAPGAGAQPTAAGPVKPGSTVSVAPKASVDMKLPNTGIMRAPKPGKFQVLERHEGLVLQAGTLLIQYSAQGKAGETLWVNMDGHRAEIPQSDVRVMVSRGDRGALRVGVLRGQVKVHRRGAMDGPVKLGAGRSVLVKTDGTVSGPKFYKGKEDFGEFGSPK